MCTYDEPVKQQAPWGTPAYATTKLERSHKFAK